MAESELGSLDLLDLYVGRIQRSFLTTDENNRD